MTLTYREGSPRLQDAGCVSKDWRALWRRLKTVPGMKELQWLRVMEVTKKGTPHHHLVIGTVDGRIRCWSRDRFQIGRYQSNFERCGCLAHVWAREWKEVTGDSYIVHAIEVTGALAAASYMAKYMGKEFDGERAKALGMARRWSTSRGWPGNGRLRLRQTEEGGWARSTWAPHHVGEDIAGGPKALLVRSGLDLTLALKAEGARKRLISKVGSYVIDDGA